MLKLADYFLISLVVLLSDVQLLSDYGLALLGFSELLPEAGVGAQSFTLQGKLSLVFLSLNHLLKLREVPREANVAVQAVYLLHGLLFVVSAKVGLMTWLLWLGISLVQRHFALERLEVLLSLCEPCGHFLLDLVVQLALIGGETGFILVELVVALFDGSLVLVPYLLV